MLRRETAVELPITPSKSATTPISGAYDKDNFETAFPAPLPSLSNRIQSADQAILRKTTTVSYLVPSMSEPPPKLYQKSSESLQKNSSTDTEYSLLPYKVIKQSSNETNTSLTGSFNVENTSFANDLSMDSENTPNVTIIDNGNSDDFTTNSKTASPFVNTDGRKTSLDILRSGSIFLKKQFSIDQEQASPKLLETDKSSVQKSCLKLPSSGTTALKITNMLKESSSTSTDESKDERNIPTINTNVVQDEIAKLSSNIKVNTDEQKDPPFNETMC